MTGKMTSPLKQIEMELRVGKPVIVPTETVYGLMARADDPLAIDTIYALKGRAFDKPLALCVTGADMAQRYADVSETARAIMDIHWPGPLTLVLPVKPGAILDKRITALGTIGLRCPDIFWAGRTGDMPFALTSANRSGEPNTKTAKDAYDTFAPDAPVVLDGGECAQGTPSAVLSLSGNKAKLLRAGVLKAGDFAAFDLDWET